jgi:hypothetical protein
MCEETGNNYECRTGTTEYALRKKVHLVSSRVQQSRYSCKGSEELHETSVRVYSKQVGVPSEYKTRTVVPNMCAASLCNAYCKVEKYTNCLVKLST